jgi:polysaccharide pyruvyl transferase WcaK-like protein
MLVLTQQAKLVGIPVALNRVGLHGYEFSTNYARLLLNLADKVSLRESDSIDICMRALGRKDCKLERDYVFDLIKPSTAKAARHPKKVGINYSDIRMALDEGFRNHVIGAFCELARLFDGQLEFYYIPFCIHESYAPENDALQGDYFWNASKGRIKYVDNIQTTSDLVDAVDEMDALVGHRFHLQVVGYGLKKLVIPLVSNLRSKFIAIARDHGVQPIFIERSQSFLTSQIEQRLVEFLDGFENPSAQAS